MKVAVVRSAIWKIETLSARVGSLSIDDRLTMLDKEISKSLTKLTKATAWDKALEHIPPTSLANVQPLYVFVAPEYLFRDIKGYSSTAFDRSSAEQVAAGLARLSKRPEIPSFLLIAGSVHWREAPTNGTDFTADYTAYSLKKQKSGKTPSEIAKKATEDFTSRWAPSASDEKDKDPIISTMSTANRPTPTHLGHNEALVYYSGVFCKRIAKAKDKCDFDGLDSTTVMVPGVGSGTFKLSDYGMMRVGVEICADHGRIQAYGKKVNLFVLISATAPLTKSNWQEAVHDGGLILHADSAERHCEQLTVPSNDLSFKGMAGKVFRKDLANSPFLPVHTQTLVKIAD